MEFWDLYDQNRNLTGEKIVRGEAIPDGFYHLVVHVCMFNSKNQMLIQQRQPFKRGWSNMWDLSVGGSAQAGDTSTKAAEREVYEELGLKVDLSKMRPAITIPFAVGYDDIYLIDLEINTNDLNLQYEEVQAVKWATEEEIISMIHQELFIPYHPSLISLLFGLRRTRDAHFSFKK